MNTTKETDTQIQILTHLKVCLNFSSLTPTNRTFAGSHDNGTNIHGGTHNHGYKRYDERDVQRGAAIYPTANYPAHAMPLLNLLSKRRFRNESRREGMQLSGAFWVT